MLKNVDLKLGNVVFQKIQVGLFKKYGNSLTSDSIKTPTVKHIGTIAPDLFKNKILIIDYPHKKLCIVDKLPSKYLKSSFVGYSKPQPLCTSLKRHSNNILLLATRQGQGTRIQITI
jgi:hypothetical protein